MVLGAFALMVVISLFMTTPVHANVGEESYQVIYIIVDKNGDGIEGVVVHLYDDNDFIEYRITSQFGWANFILVLTPPQVENLNLRIYSAPDGFEFGPEPVIVEFSWWATGYGFESTRILTAVTQPESETTEESEVAEEEATVETIEEEPVIEPVTLPEPLPVTELIDTPATIAPIIQTANTARVTNAHFLNLHRGAGVNYQAFAVLARGDEVTILGQRGGWVNVETARGTGWVFGRYLDI